MHGKHNKKTKKHLKQCMNESMYFRRLVIVKYKYKSSQYVLEENHKVTK
jgi:hypothetical protein